MDTLNHSLLYKVNHSFAYFMDNDGMQGDRIKEAMESKGWKTADLCRAMVERGYKITEQAIGKWFSGATKNIKSEYMFAIEDLTGYRARYLSDGTLPKTVDRQAALMADVMANLSDDNKSAIIAAGRAMAKPRGNHGNG